MSELHEAEMLAWKALIKGDYELSAALFEPLIQQGSITALNNLGWMLANGHLGPPDQARATQLWEISAKLGSPTAMYYLGRSHSDAGEWEKSRRSFIEGAERNHQACMYWAGKMMIRGKGGSVDLERGRELIKRAANGGNIFAQRDLLLLEMKTSTSLSRKVVLAFQLVWTGLKNLPRYLKNPNTNEFG